MPRNGLARRLPTCPSSRAPNRPPCGPSGVDYVYTFLRTFYRDTSKSTGWNNLVFPSVGMPNVLWQLQGPRSLEHVIVHEAEHADGTKGWERNTANYDSQGFSVIKTEKLEDYEGAPSNKAILKPINASQAAAFDNNVADLSNFLGWMAEPMQRNASNWAPGYCCSWACSCWSHGA